MRTTLLACCLLLIVGCKKDSQQGGVKVEVKTLGFTPGCLTVSASDSSGKSNAVTLDGGFSRDGSKVVAVLGSGVWGPDLTVTAEAKELSCSGPAVARNSGKVTLPKTGVGSLTLELDAVDRDGDGYVSNTQGNGLSGTDCDDVPDGGSGIHPGVAEVCDGLDNNCDGQIDEGVKKSFWADLDHDGFGDPASTPAQRCQALTGEADNNLDCDDTRADVHPKDGGETACDGIDDDCKGGPDDTFFIGQTCPADGGCPGIYVCNGSQTGNLCQASSAYYIDLDGDGYGTGNAVTVCAGSGYAPVAGDCNDDPDGGAVDFPGNTEVCDGVDNNCNAAIDEGVTGTYYRDQDQDGIGTSTDQVQGCSAPAGYVSASLGDDCNDDPDGGALDYPGNTEVCDGVDNNCDNQIDEGLTQTYFLDEDHDGRGNPDASVQACSRPAGYSDAGTDCDDGDPYTFPGATEICDQKDNSCTGAGVDNTPSCTGAVWADKSPVGSSVNWLAASSVDAGVVWLAGSGSASNVYFQPAQGAGFVSIGGACSTLTIPSSYWAASWADARTDTVYVGGNSALGGAIAKVQPDGGCSVVGTPPADPVHGLIGFPLSDGGVDLYAATTGGDVVHNSSATSLGSLTLNAIHGSAPTTLAAVGYTGTSPNFIPKAFLFNPGTGNWVDQSVENLAGMPARAQLNGVFVLDASHIYVVGSKGVLLRYDGSAWKLDTSAGGATTFTSVIAFGPSDVYGVSSNDNKVRRWNGSAWSVIATAPHALNTITGTFPGDVWVAGDTQTVDHWHEP